MKRIIKFISHVLIYSIMIYIIDTLVEMFYYENYSISEVLLLSLTLKQYGNKVIAAFILVLFIEWSKSKRKSSFIHGKPKS